MARPQRPLEAVKIKSCCWAELERVLALDLDPKTVMLGINNRDLETFKVDIANNARIMESAPGQQVRLEPAAFMP